MGFSSRISLWDSLFGPWNTLVGVSSFISGLSFYAQSPCTESVHSMLKSRQAGAFAGPGTNHISSCDKLFTPLCSHLLRVVGNGEQGQTETHEYSFGEIRYINLIFYMRRIFSLLNLSWAPTSHVFTDITLLKLLLSRSPVSSTQLNLIIYS